MDEAQHEPQADARRQARDLDAGVAEETEQPVIGPIGRLDIHRLTSNGAQNDGHSEQQPAFRNIQRSTGDG